MDTAKISETAASHQVRIEGWEKVSMTGVRKVLHFDDGEVTAETDCGRATVEGRGLQLLKLDPSSTEIVVVGTVTGVYYAGKEAAEKKGLRGLFG